jgi:hypothetical protein
MKEEAIIGQHKYLEIEAKLLNNFGNDLISKVSDFVLLKRTKIHIGIQKDFKLLHIVLFQWSA